MDDLPGEPVISMCFIRTVYEQYIYYLKQSYFLKCMSDFFLAIFERGYVYDRLGYINKNINPKT